ncbi:apoptosis facilitator Bcl-2-like protein 14 isoform X3 [Athene cunicularia]|uniref:apoptosis facilitator Bcl-2-like protein 14 isoform X3 n=1 Tax=Athene cunicularia TaxID=194338 RepID=UPI000EF6F794|nr:apoptosis facilitator Bcl-2-like protein 14 isoform X3 [Athene cunicularia]
MSRRAEILMESNMQVLAAEKPRWDVGRQPSGKILSLDRQGAKKVLEIYVRRSLSCCENSLVAKKTLQEGARRRGRKADGLQRSKSDFSKYSCAKLSPRKDQEEEPKAQDPDKALDDESKAPKEVSKEELEPKRKSTKNSSQGKTQRTWFKSFLNFLFKKSPEEQKENAGQKAKEKDAKAPHSSKPEGGKRSGGDLSTSPPLGRAPKRRSSLKRVFSFKKHVEEERGEAAAGARAKRPSCLPLQHVQAPTTAADAEQPDGYYARVSEEIGLIVQGSESQGSRARGCGEPPRPASADGVDEAIRRIVALLQTAGDELDRQVKEDVRLRMFFRDMSYSSFKNLADAYVHKEMTASRPDVNPQEIQFAFAVHLTAKVAGICNQAVNRIMGFGTRYLEDSFAPLSYSKILQDKEKFSTDNCESPD